MVWVKVALGPSMRPLPRRFVFLGVSKEKCYAYFEYK